MQLKLSLNIHAPIDDEVFVGSLLVTDRTHPGGLLLVHLDVERGVEALQVGARERPTRDHQPHLPQLCSHMLSGRDEQRGRGGYGMFKCN